MTLKTIPIKSLVAGALLLALTPLSAIAETWQERADWHEIFRANEASGTLLVVDKRDGAATAMVHDGERARQRFVPASTFKIPHTLFALDAGVVEDEFQVFAWDGVERDFPQWNADHDLRSGMRLSVVWLYQHFARELGEERERDYLEAIDYGNADIGDRLEHFWLEEDMLEISAEEQIEFLERLYRNELPFDEADQRLVKDLMIVGAGNDWILRGKTGWTGQLGWWVGWVERPSGPVFFALNMETPNRMADLPKRQGIVAEALRTIEALPAED
ncbi:class D beta-lactamase [Billgrantia tianxiuensis]|jgi:beta-lactamase class D|uniref:Beta-lactamase n=1 Tax=Billgrantia tianxiuensis TaxID=2497861 RepID=A0A6I6SKT2_9GAMM|nr:class D beta-lactamase [Halomonas sp. MCCC 1A11057]MCE8033754.1 class D beta-lactamase [Halomonas sp. MCCC 1A11057]QHC51328.1 class D beta-lactamase [Halomonas tianxiuensis]